MALTKKHQDAFEAHIADKVKNWRCPLCGNQSFQGRAVLKVEVGNLGGGSTWGAGMMEFGAMICTACGNTLFIHLGVPGAGLTGPKE